MRPKVVKGVDIHLAELQPTYGSFSLRGMVTGLSNERSFSEGENSSGVKWNRVSFGIKIRDNAFVYVELFGSKSPQVKVVYYDPFTKRTDKNNSKLVPYNNHTNRTDGYKLHMPVRINLNTYDEGLELISYEAVEYIRSNLKDGSLVCINGSLQISEYQGKVGESYSIQEICSLSHEESNYEAFFTQEIVFRSIENDESKQRYNVLAYIIHRKDGDISFTPYTFYINYGEDKADYIDEVIEFFTNKITFGTTVKVFGNINVYIEKSHDENGNVYLTGSTVRELSITGGSIKSIVENRYSEDDFLSSISSNVFEVSITTEEEEEYPF